MRLLDRSVENLLTSLPFAAGHGAAKGFLGLSLLYYALPYLFRARTCVCLGSGGGFVPSLMRQAQRDLALVPSQTILVDAILPEAGFGGPDDVDGWFHPDSPFRKAYPDVLVLSCRTDEAADGYLARNRTRIDYLHVDADHSAAGVADDLSRYGRMLAPGAVVTCHDANTADVEAGIAAWTAGRPVERLNFREFGAGTAVLRFPRPAEESA